VKVNLVGVHEVRKKLASGETARYFYAWRGGPPIKAEPDTNAFLAEYVRLTADRPDRRDTETVAELVIGFQRSQEFASLRERTRADYDDNLAHVLAHFADMPIRLVEEKGFRAEVKRWHSSMADTPRRADMRLAALVKVLNWAVDEERISVNKAAGISHLHHGSRRDFLWTPEQINTFLDGSPAPLARAVMLALWTGQRQGDLLSLKWSAYDGRIISLVQAKGGTRVRVVVSDELKAMLDAMPRTAITILTTGGGIPWGSGFGGYFRKWQKALGVTGACRGLCQGLHDQADFRRDRAFGTVLRTDHPRSLSRRRPDWRRERIQSEAVNWGWNRKNARAEAPDVIG